MEGHSAIQTSFFDELFSDFVNVLDLLAVAPGSRAMSDVDRVEVPIGLLKGICQKQGGEAE